MWSCNAKTLCAKDGLVMELSRYLRLEDGELPLLGAVPELQKPTYSGTCSAGDPFTSPIDAHGGQGQYLQAGRRTLRLAD